MKSYLPFFLSIVLLCSCKQNYVEEKKLSSFLENLKPIGIGGQTN